MHRSSSRKSLRPMLEKQGGINVPEVFGDNRKSKVVLGTLIRAINSRIHLSMFIICCIEGSYIKSLPPMPKKQGGINVPEFCGDNRKSKVVLCTLIRVINSRMYCSSVITCCIEGSYTTSLLTTDVQKQGEMMYQTELCGDNGKSKVFPSTVIRTIKSRIYFRFRLSLLSRRLL